MKNLHPSLQPRYPHENCDTCTFLGHFGKYDLYHCLQHGDPTVIARFGENGDYASGMGFADNGQIPALVEAKRLAEAYNLPVNRNDARRRNMTKAQILVDEFEQAADAHACMAETSGIQADIDASLRELDTARKNLLGYLKELEQARELLAKYV
jgi:hypothetical protein